MAIYDYQGNDVGTAPNYFIYSINHRGYSTDAPENTLPAFELSKKKGFWYVETDVQFTSDDVPVLLHDTTINRTARNTDGSTISGTIAINSITYEQALAYDYGIWKGPKYAGTKIPTFREFITLCKQLSIHPFIELKNDSEWTQAHVDLVANIIKEVGVENHVSFISFSKTALSLMSAIFPKARLGLGLQGTYSTSAISTLITNATSLKTDDNDVCVSVNYQNMTSDYYASLKAAYINPILWTVNTEEVALSMDDSVVGVLSDCINAGKVIEESLLA